MVHGHFIVDSEFSRSVTRSSSSSPSGSAPFTIQPAGVVRLRSRSFRATPCSAGFSSVPGCTRWPLRGVHRRELEMKIGKCLFDHGADRTKGMIWRNESLRGAVAEHPVGLEVRSAHKSISLIMKGIYARIYHGNHIYVT